MSNIRITCPSCNAIVDGDTSQTEFTCRYCGNMICFGKADAELQPQPDPVIMERYNADMMKWKNQSILIGIIKTVLSLGGWITFFMPHKFLILSVTLLFLAALLLFVGPLVIARNIPNGSTIPNGNIEPPKKLKTGIEFFLLFLFIAIVCFFIGAIFLLFQ
ncbi:MAG: hypothetical protein K6G33_11880 [Ruminococcus sp.]|uniref:hypothetical protein n=1 Tax=Ruminococcus sp. TaxID=41978 RepID=UPI0025DFCC0E|nr:hypothetical protein [Ruminococcus sp.]MCR5601425.1 hypothetical protein [Ruminococcus sp.]